MIIQNVIYRVYVKIAHDDDEVHFVNINNFFEDSLKLRK
jgi:hypothetical protein